MELSIQRLTCAYGKRQVLHDISVDALRSGEVIAVIGPNAAGKSTLFRCLAGLTRYQGVVSIDGVDTRTMKRTQVNRKIAYMPQDNLANVRMTVFEAVLLSLQVNAAWRVSDEDLDRVHRTLDALGITHLALRGLNELSGGQRQMVSIGQALVRQPDAIILDEPTNNLGVEETHGVLRFVRNARDSGHSCIFIAHNIHHVFEVVDRIVVLRRGEVVADDIDPKQFTVQKVEEVITGMRVM
ncbi:MAG: ABC transporter ATP-binding protein [Thermomicrobiales bacterium]|nr:ABC transporter ATP-binding protein [Thermomicrobiales bacterium]